MLKIVRTGEVNQSNAEEISKKYGLPFEAAAIMDLRGVDPQEFLNPDVFHDPYLLTGMKTAVERIETALSNGESICVYGDYDVDGIMAISIVYDYLKNRGASVECYMPARQDEGYGLNKSALWEARQRGVSLLITVDCGISALEEAEYAREIGIDLVITDHHSPLETLPRAIAVINPRQSGDGYPFKELCGAGVAYKLVRALGGGEEYLDRVAVATVADIVSLTGENRALLTEGLKRINLGEACPAIRYLLNSGKQKVEESDISFGIAPKINAVGRMGDARAALDLFLMRGEKQIAKQAKLLDEANERRRDDETHINAQINDIIKRGECDPVHDRIIVLRGDWNSGVIGIVAAKLVGRFNRPVLLFANSGNDGLLTGSARSIRGIDIFKTLSRFSNLFEKFGGHEMAAGITIKAENYSELKRLLLNELQMYEPAVFLPRMNYDLELNSAAVTIKLIDQLARLAPFGTGNPAPVFKITAKPHNISVTGTGAHLKFFIGQDNGIECIAFNQAHKSHIFESVCELLVTLEVNEWRGTRRAQCKLKAVKPVEVRNVETFVQNMRWRFHEAFFAGLQSGEELPRGCGAGMSEFVEACRENIAATVALCKDPKSSEELLSLLKREGILDETDVYIAGVDDECGYNCVVLAPMPGSVDYSRYDNIFVFGVCEQGALSAELNINREELAKTYNCIVKTVNHMNVYTSKDTFIKTVAKECMQSYAQALFGFKVFCELEFLSVRDPLFTVEMNKSSQKRELSESKLYSALAGGV